MHKSGKKEAPKPGSFIQMKTNSQTINERLADELFRKQKLTAYRIAKDTGFLTQSLDGWLKGKDGKFVTISAEDTAKLCQTYSLDVVYIMFGNKSKIKRK